MCTYIHTYIYIYICIYTHIHHLPEVHEAGVPAVRVPPREEVRQGADQGVEQQPAHVLRERPPRHAEAEPADDPEQRQDPVLVEEDVVFGVALVEFVHDHADDAGEARDVNVQVPARERKGRVQQRVCAADLLLEARREAKALHGRSGREG